MPAMAGNDEPWQRRTSDELGEAAATTFAYRWVPSARPRLIRLHGPCPQCGHEFAYDWPVEIARTLAPGPVTVECVCIPPHLGAPEGGVGCGAYWDLDIPRPGSTTTR